MKVWLTDVVGGPETLRVTDVDAPAVQPGQLRIAVKAAGLNYPDVLQIRNGYQRRLPRPLVPGSEVAGVVEALGSDVDGWAIGDRVVGLCECGGLAELALVSADNCFALPPQVSFDKGAGLIFTYATAHYALTARASLKADEQVLVLGAGGGIGSAATELASACGARVTAAASSREKLALACRNGASTQVLYPTSFDDSSSKQLLDALKAATGGRGFDVIVDPVGGALCDLVLRVVNWGARYLILGFASSIPRPPLNLVLLRGATMLGVDWYGFGKREADHRAQGIRELFDMVGHGTIDGSPENVVPFESAGEMLERIASRSITGKTVVRIATA